MVRKKTTATVETPSTPIDEEGFYYLPKPLLMEYRALDSECRHAHLCLRVISQELDALLTKNPEIQRKMAEKAALISEASNKKDALQEVHKTIEAIFNVKITEIAIDDLTGHIHQLVEGKASGIPMKALTPATKVRKARRGASAKTP